MDIPKTLFESLIVKFRVWPNGYVQEVSEAVPDWLGDDFVIVKALDEQEAWAIYNRTAYTTKAQLDEHLATNQEVVSSNLTGGTKINFGAKVRYLKDAPSVVYEVCGYFSITECPSGYVLKKDGDSANLLLCSEANVEVVIPNV